MLYRVVITSQPTVELVTKNELRLQARTLFPGEDDPFEGAEDDLLDTILQSAVDELDAPVGHLGRSLMQRECRLLVDSHPEKEILIPHPPIISIDEIKYIDTNEAEQTIDLSDVNIDITDPNDAGRLWHKSAWPSMSNRPGRMWVDYTAGYATAAEVPAVIRHAILIKAATYYRDRESTIVGTITAQHEHISRMLDNYRHKTSYPPK